MGKREGPRRPKNGGGKLLSFLGPVRHKKEQWQGWYVFG